MAMVWCGSSRKCIRCLGSPGGDGAGSSVCAWTLCSPGLRCSSKALRRFLGIVFRYVVGAKSWQLPVTSTLLDQAHNAMERQVCMMKGFHHPQGSQQAFLIGLAHLYNLGPYQRRAKHAGQGGVEVGGGRVPTQDWF